MRSFRAAMFILICISLLMVPFISGCGSDEEPAAETTTGERPATTVPAVPTIADKPLPAPEPGPGQPVAEEQPSPYGEGTTSSQAVGVTIDGMQLSDVRWADHGGFFRIVFDMGTPEGDPVLQVPHAETSMSADRKTITVTLSGIRSLGSSANAEAESLDVDDQLVDSIVRIPSHDDQALIYEIRLSREARYSLAGLGSPGRIVIDINR